VYSRCEKSTRRRFLKKSVKRDDGRIYNLFTEEAAFWETLLRRAPAPKRAEEIHTLTVIEPFLFANV
jgi:hypothetical protein